MIAEPTTRPTSRHWPKLVLALAVMLCAGWLLVSGSYRDLSPERLEEFVRRSGAWGPVFYLLAFTFVQPLGLPGHLFCIGASLVWPRPLAFVLSIVGATLGQVVAFFFYRYIAYEWAQKHVPTRLRPFEQRIATLPVRSVIVLRLVLFTWTFSPALLGVSRVRVGPMIVGTVIGLAPMIALDVWVGASAVRWVMAWLGVDGG